jgi:hypothetical protein
MDDIPPLSDDAHAILEAGWVVGPGGALLLRALWNGAATSFPQSYVGKYEYDTNDVYLSLADLASDMNSYLARAASRGVLFANELLVRASDLPCASDLAAVVGIFMETEHEDFLRQGARLRFFSRRGDYPDWFEDLESFSAQAVAVIDFLDE